MRPSWYERKNPAPLELFVAPLALEATSLGGGGDCDCSIMGNASAMFLKAPTDAGANLLEFEEEGERALEGPAAMTAFKRAKSEFGIGRSVGIVGSTCSSVEFREGHTAP